MAKKPIKKAKTESEKFDALIRHLMVRFSNVKKSTLKNDDKIIITNLAILKSLEDLKCMIQDKI